MGPLDVVQILLERGADIHQQDKYGRTALHEASENSQLDIVKLLLDCRAKIDQQNNDGSTALHVAINLRLPNYVGP
jgi:ankyrin repeat protein